MIISPSSAEPTTSARTWAASNGSAVQPSDPARPVASEVAAGKLAELAADLADAMGRDRHLVVEPVPARDLDRALEHEPGRRRPLADLEDHLARREAPRLTAGKALGGLDLHIVEHREHLMTTGVDQAHARVSCSAGTRASS